MKVRSVHLLLVFVACLTTPCFGADEGPIDRSSFHPWERHVRGFRTDHQFSFVSGVSSGLWDVDKFGVLEAEKFHNTGIMTRFQYSFHIPIYRGFGYLLGSSTGYHFESADGRRDFQPVSALQFPGVLGGFTLNFNPTLRMSGGLEFYLERHENLAAKTEDGSETKISVTMQAVDLGFYTDVFYDLAWAFRLEAHGRFVQFLAPRDSLIHEVNARIKKSDSWVAVGLLYHLL